MKIDDVNACEPIFSTLFPIVTFSSEDVIIKAASFISLTESGIIISFNFELYAKQYSSISVTVFGIVYVVNSFC